MRKVSISSGNSKLGGIASVSLSPIDTCREGCPCWKKCYAEKLCKIRPSMRKAYNNNLDILRNEPELYWRDVEAAIMTSRFFRFHVGGDIPDTEYLLKMCEVANRNKHCEILCFTKRYEMVNDAVTGGVRIPKNLHVVFSAWPGLTMENPYNFPEAHIRLRNGKTDARSDAYECGGNCTNCVQTDSGCWNLKSGEQVVFNEH